MTFIRYFFVHPWGVEPQSSEPESEILSIELRVPISFCKFTAFFVYLQHGFAKFHAFAMQIFKNTFAF